MNSKKVILIILMFIVGNNLYGQDNQFTYDSHEAKFDIESLINQFKPLIEKLPTYKTYSPAIFTMDKNNFAGLQMIYEENSPQNIDSCRIKYAKMFKADKSLSDKKLILICFLEKTLNPINGKKTESIAIYVEHLNESSGYVYLFPYFKSLFGNIKFDENMNFRKSIDKLMLY